MLRMLYFVYPSQPFYDESRFKEVTIHPAHLPCIALLESLYIMLRGPDCRLIAGTKENSDDPLLDWILNSMQFGFCRFSAGFYVLRTRFEHFWVFLAW